MHINLDNFPLYNWFYLNWLKCSKYIYKFSTHILYIVDIAEIHMFYFQSILFHNLYQAVRQDSINNEQNSISLDQLRIKIIYRIRRHKLLRFQRALLSSFLSAINDNIRARAIREWFYRATASIAYLVCYIEYAARV